MAGKPQVSNSPQQNSDTQTKPLLPLEFCSIERAARLLGCEVEDLWHWREIGAIQFCINAGLYTEVYQDPLSDFLNSLMDDDDKGLVLKPERKYEFSTWSAVTQKLQMIENKYSGVASISGFWSLEQTLESGSLASIVTPYTGERTTRSSYACFIVLGENPPLYIMKPDIELLYQSINKGASLPNRYNDEAKRMAAEEREKMVVPQERETTGPFNLIELLLKLNPETSDVQYKPTTCFNVIDQLCAKAQIENPISKSTFESWIRKINSNKNQCDN